MRWLFVLLVLCNGALYLWYTGVGGGAKPQGLERMAQREVARLMLMSELAVDQRRASPPDREGAAPAGTPDVDTGRPASPGDGERQTPIAVTTDLLDKGAAAGQPMPRPSREVPAEAHREHVLFRSLFAKPQKAPGPLKPDVLEGRFLSHSKDRQVSRPVRADGASGEATGMRAKPSDAVPPGHGGARVVSAEPAGKASRVKQLSPEGEGAERECIYLGGFASHAAAQSVLDRLLSAGVQGVVQADEYPVAPVDYWVYLPDPGDARSVKRVRDDLSKAGIDSYQVQRGELQGAVSVGLYRNHDSALALRRRLEGLGFLARIRERGEYRERYGVLLVKDPQARDNPLILQLNEEAGVELEKKSCSGVASD